MKNGKRPTRRQKEAIRESGMDPDDWYVFKVEHDRLHIVHRSGKTKKVIPA